MGPKLVPAKPFIGREAADEDVRPDNEAHGTVLVRPILMPSDLLARRVGHWNRGSGGRGSGSRNQEVRAVDRELLA